MENETTQNCGCATQEQAQTTGKVCECPQPCPCGETCNCA
jgi:hypothetical protein